MFRSLHMKLVLIMLLLITSLMAIVGAFLMTSITSFYIDEFYQQMESVFKKGISKARLGALEMKGSEKVKSSKELLENFENEGLSVADSLRLIRQGLIENPDTLRFPVKALAD